MTTLPRILVAGALAATAAFVATNSASADGASGEPTAGSADVASYWTPARIAAAQPRDLVVDARGVGYLRGVDGSLTPYGRSGGRRLVQEPTASPSSPTPMAPPSGGSDRTGPSISDRFPADGAPVGGSVTFSATVTDESGVKSVSFVIVYPDGRTQSFSPGATGDVYSTTISGFSDETWGWYVSAKDSAGRGGNSTTSDTWSFVVDTGGGGGDGGGGTGDVVANSRWTDGGDIQLAAGRILFEMPELRGRNKIVGWNAYVCSGTTVTDTHTGASVVLTAAHCVYDDVAKEFARNVLFIPGQDDGGTDRTDTNCGNDPIGCWSPSYGVVDANWTTRTFPDNVEWDYAYYVVPAAGAHSGTGSKQSLEEAVTELDIGFDSAQVGSMTHALGYSYSDDPNFMYCAEPMEVETAGVNWWLPNCDLSGGSSGGPWVQPMDTATGSGPIVSVNSWGYTNQPGMAGPLLDGSAACVFATANNEDAVAVDRGVVVSGCAD